ncbi:hypothetical protein CONLIGDRAFT_674153 [Coniochaeta ligniaria NRRL 30616]|uniref:Swi5-dependent recombination DNA repair protein 1 n=1 Tax=Coniochaeta ligniaria NRRL 30616 TaxID=1408157 RepID=A0A1J7J495_9PEZI|nr:hypothetical protein CONLIGDRAFT_674153 [Coniochaeta ligniaria NRRL 30616]
MSSSSMPAAKRRRVDAAHETLKKPFRSPMVKRPQPQAGPGITASSPATPASVQRRESIGLSRLSTPSKTANAFVTPSKPGSRARTAVPFLGQKPGSKLDGLSDKDAEFLDKLTRRRREAELKTREVEKGMELVRQAARIESGKETANEDLDKLVRKWKGACRTAAEELFELIRGRVDSMGGGAAWRETRQQTGWFDDEGAEEKKKRDEAGEGADEREELEGLEEVQESEDGPEQSEERDFTMHMMLKSLNIDPKIIGYDPVEDKWRDWG